MKPETIFSDISDLRAYVEGLTADTTYEQLVPSINTVTADIMAIITADVYVAIREYEPEEGEDNTGLELLKSAVAAGTAYKYAIFAAVKKNGADGALYKYQFEEMKNHYIESQWKAMDALLDYLDTNSDEWKETDQYAQRQALPVKNAREFNDIYGIDNSSFFYHKVLPLIRSTWQYQVAPLIPAGRAEDAADLAKQILVYRVLAKVVMQFADAELPRSIRIDYTHEYTKETGMQTRDKLFNQFLGQAQALEQQLKTMARAANATVIADDNNREDYKFYGML